MNPALLFSLALLSASGPLATDMYLPVLPSIVQEFSVTESLVQLTLTGFFIGMGAGQLIIGPISDIVGRQKLLIAGALLALLASVLAAVAPTIGVLIIARALQGLGGGACAVLARAVVPDLQAGNEAAKTFATLMAINSLAPAIAPIIGGLLADPIGWRGIYWVLVGIHAVQLLVVIMVIPETGHSTRDQGHVFRQVIGNYGAVLTNHRVWGYIIAMAFGFTTMFCYISASSFVFQDQFDFSARAFSLFFAVNASGLFVTSMVSRHIVSKVGAAALLRVGILVSLGAASALLIGTVLHAPLPVLLLNLFICVAPTALIMGNSTALATSIMRERAGSVTAIMGCAQAGIAGAASPLMGLGGNPLLTMSGGMVVCALIATAGMAYARRVNPPTGGQMSAA
ncbi:MAG: multidrug effflux MFS transporter [Corynebacterium sp.]|nr:multidrug effflux MFS transporter [Corynebacterium sp.]